MVKLALVVVALAAGCFHDRYRCTVDTDCDVGELPRCDDGSCTARDPACPTGRRYNEHSGELANTCFAGQVALANPCAGGQPAAIPDGCAATVCEAMPACCGVGWSDACAEQAQLRCGIACDTRLAVTATRGMIVEHWQFDWDPAARKWSATQVTDLAGQIAWVGPPPGGSDPRLAGMTPALDALVVGGQSFPEPVDGRTIQAITSVDFDRSGRDTIAMTYDTGTKQFLQLIDVATGATRDLEIGTGQHLAWGDADRDAFPDGFAGRGGGYTLVRNVEDADHLRDVEATQTSNMGGGATPGSPQLRQLDWADLTGDGRLDLLAIGSQVRLHAEAGALSDTPLIVVDCNPPVLNGTTTCNDPATEQQVTSWAGAAVPTLTDTTVVVGMFTDPSLMQPRKEFRFTFDTATKQVTAVPLTDLCSGSTCTPIVAMFARDLDGDGRLDVIGLDTNLQIYVVLAGDASVRTMPLTITTQGKFTNLFGTVTGSLIP